jgi:hypothetical protein
VTWDEARYSNGERLRALVVAFQDQCSYQTALRDRAGGPAGSAPGWDQLAEQLKTDLGERAKSDLAAEPIVVERWSRFLDRLRSGEIYGVEVEVERPSDEELQEILKSKPQLIEESMRDLIEGGRGDELPC